MAKLGTTINNVIRGDTRTVNLTFYESDGVTPINLAGGTVYFTVQNSSDPSDDSTVLMFQKTATSFTHADAGQHTFTLTHSDTDIAAGTYWFDAQFKDAVGNYVSSYRGKFVVQSDVTRT
jgi:hypothetical protein